MGNKLAMSASSDALEASIAAQRVVKESDVTSSPSPFVKSKDWQTETCLPWVNALARIPTAFVILQ